jgi:glucan phosphoethanolaminetransferase (alkaline phosphatase superfamily)
MESFYRRLIPTALWLGVAAFVLAVFLVLFNIRPPLVLTPRGFIRGAQTLLLIAVAGYCAHLTAHNQRAQ